MNRVSQKRARDRLTWVEDARQGIIRAIGDDVIKPTFKAYPSVDPLKFFLKIALLRPLAKATKQPLRTYLRCWAETMECEVPIINITDKEVKAEVLIQKRFWNRDHIGRFRKGGKRFERRPR